MKCYSAEFGIMSNFPYPRKPIQFDSIEQARRAYAEFVQDCENFGMGEPANVWVFFGNIKEVEYIGGVWLYRDYPDRILEVGPKGGIKVINS